MTETTVTISWDPVQAAIDRYMVRYTSADGDAREVPVGKEQSGTVLTGLRPGVEYTVQVWAERGARESRKADTTAETGTSRDRNRGPFTRVRCGEGAGKTVVSPEDILQRGSPLLLWGHALM